MEQKLKEYRALRRRKELIENTKETVEKTKKKISNFLVPKFITNMLKEKEKKEEEVLLIEDEHPKSKEDLSVYYEEQENSPTEITESEPIEEAPQEPWKYFIIKWAIYTIIWATGWVFFLEQGFGAVYFAISVLIGICLNTSTRRKKPGEISAYSVFNRNCKSIDGTLKAEELQRQMMFGIGGIRIF